MASNGIATSQRQIFSQKILWKAVYELPTCRTLITVNKLLQKASKVSSGLLFKTRAKTLLGPTRTRCAENPWGNGVELSWIHRGTSSQQPRVPSAFVLCACFDNEGPKGPEKQYILARGGKTILSSCIVPDSDRVRLQDINFSDLSQ
jgi:hypothetical protein